MNRALPVLAVLALCGCPQQGPKLAQLHVSCGNLNLDTSSDPPPSGQSCAAGTPFTLSYDNDGNYTYVTVMVVTRDNIEFLLPDSEAGESVAIQPTGKNVPLPGSFTAPAKARDVVAIFSHEVLKAKDVAQHLRDV